MRPTAFAKLNGISDGRGGGGKGTLTEKNSFNFSLKWLRQSKTNFRLKSQTQANRCGIEFPGPIARRLRSYQPRHPMCWLFGADRPPFRWCTSTCRRKTPATWSPWNNECREPPTDSSSQHRTGRKCSFHRVWGGCKKWERKTVKCWRQWTPLSSTMAKSRSPEAEHCDPLIRLRVIEN